MGPKSDEPKQEPSKRQMTGCFEEEGGGCIVKEGKGAKFARGEGGESGEQKRF